MTLKGLRERTGLSQDRVGRKLDVDQSAVAHWESGVHAPLKKYRKKLARLYGVTADELEEAIKASRKEEA